jgi:hypothetical protein
MYLSNTEPFTSLDCLLNVVFHVLCGPMPQDVETRLLLPLQFFNLSLISIAVLENMSPTQGYIKEPPFPNQLWDRSGPGIEPGRPAWQAVAQAAQPSTTTSNERLKSCFLKKQCRESKSTEAE